MNKIEFADINKFLTSLGLIFIASGFLFPWFIGQNVDIIVLNEEQLEGVTDSSRAIIENQQQYLLFLSDHVTWIVSGFVLIGLVLMLVGILRWKKRQQVIDSIQDEELKAKRQLNIGVEEKKEVIGSELEPEIENKEEAIQKYINIENQIGLKLTEFYKVNYQTSQNIRIGEYAYDVILKSKIIEIREDFIVEIKFMNSIPVKSRLIDILNRFVQAVNYYELTQKRRATPVLILIFEVEIGSYEPDSVLRALGSYVNEIKPNLRLKIFSEANISTLEAPELING